MDGRALADLVKIVTKDWARQRKAEEKQASRTNRRREALVKSSRITIKEAAFEVMEAAYLKASGNGTLPAHARQIMYAARGPIQEMTDRQLNDQYFTQTLLPDYVSEYGRDDWDVVFDARGHFTEPHTRLIVPLGTLAVRKHLQDIEHTDRPGLAAGVEGGRARIWPTCGPENRYSAVLFIEKEGFMPLFQHPKVRLAERYDLAIMSTKGMSVTASRLLVDTLCQDIPLLVLHDFDKSGFSIVGTLHRDTRRYEYLNSIEVIDLGLRLEDIKAHGLASEAVSYGETDPQHNLRENGATEDEIEFLCRRSDWRGYHGKRVELNAFTSDMLIKWIEGKLKQHGIEKVIPEDDDLDLAYRRVMVLDFLDRKRLELAPLAVIFREIAS